MERELRNLKGIPKPPTDFHASSQIRPPLRRISTLNYVKTDQERLVELQFNSDIELALFERFVRDTRFRLSEYRADQDREIRYFFFDSRMDVLPADIERWASEVLALICASIALHFPSFFPPRVRGFIEVKKDGGLAAFAPAQRGMTVGQDSFPRLLELLNHPSNLLAPYLAISEQDGDFNEALMLCGQAMEAMAREKGNPWATLYRSFEIVRAKFGGEDELSNQFEGVSKSTISRFKNTINHQDAIGMYSRHARLVTDPPSDPMGFSEALEFVLCLIRAWAERSPARIITPAPQLPQEGPC